MIIDFLKLTNSGLTYGDTYEVLGCYEVFGSKYIITSIKSNSELSLEVMEFVPGGYVHLSDETKKSISEEQLKEGYGDALVMAVKPSKTPVAKYIERVYLNGINNFFVEGNEFELPDKLIDDPDRGPKVLPYIPSAPKSSDNSHFKFDDDSMFEGFGYVLMLDDKSFALSKMAYFKDKCLSDERKAALKEFKARKREK